MDKWKERQKEKDNRMRETNLGHKKRVELNSTKLLENFPSSFDKLRCDLADVDNIVDVLIKTNTNKHEH